jgi:hypothetical protein
MHHRLGILMVLAVGCASEAHAQTGDQGLHVRRSAAVPDGLEDSPGGKVVIELVLDRNCDVVSKRVLEGLGNAWDEVALKTIDRKFLDSWTAQYYPCEMDTVLVPVMIDTR